MSTTSPFGGRVDNYESSSETDKSEFVYPDIELDEYTKLWRDNSVTASKEEDVEAMKYLKEQAVGGTGSLAVTLALLLTTAVPAVIQSPCPNSLRKFRSDGICETLHILGWAVTSTSCFIGTLSATSPYAHAMYTPPSRRGVDVLLSPPRTLGGRDAVTTTMIALECAVCVDVFTSYSTPVYVTVLLTSVISYPGYHISDAVLQCGCYGVANRYQSVAWGSYWYSLFVNKLKFKNTKNIMWKKDHLVMIGFRVLLFLCF